MRVKLDRVLANSVWSINYPCSHVMFHESGVSDHSPMLLSIKNPRFPRQPFRFMDLWAKHSSFKQLVLDNWSRGVDESRVIQKLKRLKPYFRSLHQEEYAGINDRISAVEADLQGIQKELSSAFSADLVIQGKIKRQQLSELYRDEDEM